MIVTALGHVLSFDNKTEKGTVVFEINVSCSRGTFTMEFSRKDLHSSYRQPMEADRVKVGVDCGQDMQPWYIVDGTLQLICRETTLELVSS